MLLPIAKWLGRSLKSSVPSFVPQRARRFQDWKRFWRSYTRYQQMRAKEGEKNVLHLAPSVGDDRAITEIEPIYFYQDAWAFEKIVQNRPLSHVDVGSHHKFVALLSKVVPTTMIDIRPLQLPLDTLQFREGSILEMPFETGSLESVSSMCVVEHIGLGRYGDPLDVWGTEKALAELKRVVAPGGNLYLSIPISDVNATFFNANRIFQESTLRTYFAPFEVVESRYIYGNEFGDSWKNALGTGCYYLRAPLE